MTMKTIFSSFLAVLVSISFVNGAPMGALKWLPYQNTSLRFGLKLPNVWQVKENKNVVGFTSPVHGNGHAAMGILKSSKKGLSLQDAAKKELGVSGRAEGWTLSNAQFAGLPALKVASLMKDDPTQKMVQFYVQAGDDLYLIQCIAPVSEWNTYNALFATMIRTFQFSLQ